jgi:hypothetical protein
MTPREAQRRRAQSQQSSALRVIPFLEWCDLRGFSRSTGRRIIAAGKVKITELSDRRIGIREDHDREYLDSCIRTGA